MTLRLLSGVVFVVVLLEKIWIIYCASVAFSLSRGTFFQVLTCLLPLLFSGSWIIKKSLVRCLAPRYEKFDACGCSWEYSRAACDSLVLFKQSNNPQKMAYGADCDDCLVTRFCKQVDLVR